MPTRGYFPASELAGLRHRQDVGAAPVLLELDLSDARAALFDLFRRNDDLPHVLVGLVEVRLQLEYALVHARDVVDQAADLGLYLARRLAHARVLLDLQDDVDGEHQMGRRDDDDFGAEGLLHDVVEAVVQVGVKRIRRHEHEREVLGLAGNEIFLRDVADVLVHVLPHAGCRRAPLFVGFGVAVRGEGLKRKFGVDDQRSLVGKKDHAIRTHLVAERMLECVAILRQAVANDDFHAALAERAALLLVGQHRLQRSDLRGEFGDVLLRAVDDREPLIELLQVLGGVLRRLLQRIPEAVRDRIRAGR